MSELYSQFSGVLLVLAILAAFLWFARSRGLATWKFGPAGARIVEVVERVPLGPQHVVHVLSIEGRRMVVVCSPGACQVIAELTAHAASPQEMRGRS